MHIQNGVAGLFMGTLFAAIALTALPGTAQGAGSESVPAGDTLTCQPPAEIADPSDAVKRNLVDLAAPKICVMLYEFDEGSLHWRFLVVRNTSRPSASRPQGVFWVVPHDDEGAAFDSAVHGLRRYGGTLVAVKTGGHRLNGTQDPNRNFDLGSGPLCREQKARSPMYTTQVLRWWNGKDPIVGLHTNERGFDGDRNQGRGTISIQLGSPRLRPFRARQAIGASPDDTMVYVASRQTPDGDPELRRLVDRLNARRVNVAYEIVGRASNDCSLSNYVVLRSLGRYYNVEVVHGDTKWQREIIQILMSEIGIKPV